MKCYFSYLNIEERNELAISLRACLQTMAAESEQLLGVCRSAALTHEEQYYYYALQMAWYPQAREEDMRRRQVELERSTAWATARNEATFLDMPYSPTSPGTGACNCGMSSNDDLFDSDS